DYVDDDVERVTHERSNAMGDALVPAGLGGDFLLYVAEVAECFAAVRVRAEYRGSVVGSAACGADDWCVIHREGVQRSVVIPSRQARNRNRPISRALSGG